jgi:hypothetical protein
VAELDDIRRIIQRDLSGREVKRVNDLLPEIAPFVETNEQVLKATTGQWYNRRDCLLLATSRQLIVADDQRVDPMPYATIKTLDFDEKWRSARLAVRGLGVGADVSGIHLDQARELKQLIQAARRTSQAP